MLSEVINSDYYYYIEVINSDYYYYLEVINSDYYYYLEVINSDYYYYLEVINSDYYYYRDFDCLFKIVLNCNNDKNSVLYSDSRHFRTSVKDFGLSRQMKTKGRQKGF